ncbi:hypothetical protein ACYSNV_11295 [Myroides sp. LJL119]
MRRVYFILLMSFGFTGCFLEKEHCEEMTAITLAEKYNLILNSKPESSYRDGVFYYELQGKDLETQKDTLIKVYNYRWHDIFEYYWTKGDTLIKQQESLIVEIHKKDRIYYMEWNCKQPLINGVPSINVTPPPH